MSGHHHDLYDNGCTVCDAIAALEADCNGTAFHPPWVLTEADREACTVLSIRHILRTALPHYQPSSSAYPADVDPATGIIYDELADAYEAMLAQPAICMNTSHYHCHEQNEGRGGPCRWR